MANAALRILRKDIRRLWPQGAATVTLIGLAALNILINPYANKPWFSSLDLVASLACCALAIAAVHEERLIGDNQYWLTRPYSRRTLLAEKALFLLIFINLPLLVFQWIAIALAGFSPLNWISALLWRQVFVSIFFVVPAVAMSTVTRNLSQVVAVAVAGFAALALGIPSFFLGPTDEWGSLVWIRVCALALVIMAGSATAIALQYSRRRTTLAALSLACAFVLCVATAYAPAWGGAFTIQKLFSPQPSTGANVRVGLDESRIGSHPVRYGERYRYGPDVRLDIPVRVEAPAGMWLGGIWSSVAISGRAGNWRSGWQPFNYHGLPGGDWLTLYLPQKVFEEYRDAAVFLSVTLDLGLFRTIAVVPQYDLARIQKIGICKFKHGACYAPAQKFALTFYGNNDFLRVEPFPINAGFQGVEQINAFSIFWNRQQTDFAVSRPIAYVQQSFVLREVQLKDISQ